MEKPALELEDFWKWVKEYGLEEDYMYTDPRTGLKIRYSDEQIQEWIDQIGT